MTDEKKSKRGGRRVTPDKQEADYQGWLEKARKLKYAATTDFSEARESYVGLSKSIKLYCTAAGCNRTLCKTTPSKFLDTKGCPNCAKTGSSLLKFLRKAEEIHGDRYIYNLVDYVNSTTHVKIICRIHGIFEQSPISHTQGSNCRKCSGKYSPTTLEWIEMAREKHGEKYDYSEVAYIKNNQEIKIICPFHKHVHPNGVFLQKPKAHLKSKTGCRDCAGNQPRTVDDWIRAARVQHGDKYDYSALLSDPPKNNKVRVNIFCKVHNKIFSQALSNHVNMKQGCPDCGKEKLNDERPRYSSSEEWIDDAIKIHGDRYDYKNVVYNGYYEPVRITCRQHGPFMQRPFLHIRGHGCTKCNRGEVMCTNDWIEVARRVHGDKYDYDQVVYKNKQSKVSIRCNAHGYFEQTSTDHIHNGAGCPICAGNKQPTHEEWVQIANKIHNNKYTYISEYVNAKTPINIVCPNHGPFQQAPYEHVCSNGCIKCNLCPDCQLWRTMGNKCSYCMQYEQYTETLSKLSDDDKQKIELKPRFKHFEYHTLVFLRDNLPDVQIVHNRSVGIDCTGGHFYPDMRIDCTYFQLIIEVDEKQHRGADYACDERRMYDITAKLGQPCIFLRYNPNGKHSNLNVLLMTVQKCLQLANAEIERFEQTFDDDENQEISPTAYETLGIDDYKCFRVDYLFYEDN